MEQVPSYNTERTSRFSSVDTLGCDKPNKAKACVWPSVKLAFLGCNSGLGRDTSSPNSIICFSFSSSCAGAGWEGAGWKVGAASMDVRKAENIPSPSPGRLFTRSVMMSPAEVPSEFFVNYRLCECEFAFQLGQDFAVS